MFNRKSLIRKAKLLTKLMSSQSYEVKKLIEAMTNLELDKSKKRAIQSKEYEKSGFILKRWKNFI